MNDIVNYKHQDDILARSIDKEYWALLMEPGTGKTRVAIKTAEYWATYKDVDCVIVVCPKSLIGTWAKIELGKHSELPYQVFSWYSTFSKSMKSDLIKKVRQSKQLLYFVCNPDSLSSKKTQQVINYLYQHRNIGWIYDESTAIKSPKATRTKVAIELAQRSMFRRILTGTPITNQPMDVYTQIEFLKPGALGFRSYYSMRHRYCEIKENNYGGRSFQEIIGYRDLDDLREKLEVFSSFVKLEDCVDLPEQSFRLVDVELTSEQEEIYEKLRLEAIAFVKDHEVTAVNALALLVKLHQVAIGQIKVGDNKYISIKSNRPETLIELLNETKDKVIVWSNYVGVTQSLLRDLGGRAVGINSTHGPITRQKIIESWRVSDVQALVLNPQSAAHGLTLNEAKTAIFYSNSFNLEHRLQALGRNYRIGQTSKTRVIDMIAQGTVEVKIMQALIKKRELMSEIMDKDKLLDMLESSI